MKMNCFAACLALAALAAGASAPVFAQTEAAQIFTCTDASGKKLTSDRPIPECNNREQRVLNGDGSVRRVQGPTQTADERAEAEARDQKIALEEKQRREAIQRDRNLLARFPNEAAHRKARGEALDVVNNSLRVSEARLTALAKERKPLMDEAEFYVKQPLPSKLKGQLDANDATTDAQRSLVKNQKDEVLRIEDRYDAELARLKLLWGGARPGSMGMIAASASAPAPSVPKKK
ncbi:MAG: DUF4124 domain-containing protein [Burkholderiales bacterium]